IRYRKLLILAAGRLRSASPDSAHRHRRLADMKLNLPDLSHMFIVHTYPIAVRLCVVTMLCWGSWANTQKLAGKTLRFELFYWDYVIGIMLFSLISAFTLGSFGSGGRSFLADLRQAGMF